MVMKNCQNFRFVDIIFLYFQSKSILTHNEKTKTGIKPGYIFIFRKIFLTKILIFSKKLLLYDVSSFVKS